LDGEQVAQIVSYCLMPNHYHVLLKCESVDIASEYARLIQDSFTRFYNIQNNRKGPLWQSRVRIKQIYTNSQLLHVSRYIHLNPSTAGLVEKPEDWRHSSYFQYISNPMVLRTHTEISIRDPYLYRLFVESNIHYQQKLKSIHRLLTGLDVNISK
jgi:putative transposase